MTTSTETAVGTQIYRVYIKAAPQKIWDAITKPEWTERYGYRVREEFDLRPGGAFKAFSNQAMCDNGAPEVGVDGEVIESDPPRRLVQTWRMAMDPATAAEGFSRLTYEIVEGSDGVSKLTIVHELAGMPRLAAMVSGSLEDTGAGGGWMWVLSDLKSLLETGSPLNWQGGHGAE
jgi:uncharacterized protein YndB with AHSA1/START domain